MQQQGFDYCYDKRLYDRIEHEDVEDIQLHLQCRSWPINWEARSLHREPRQSPEPWSHFAGAKAPGRSHHVGNHPQAQELFHEGQFKARRNQSSDIPGRHQDDRGCRPARSSTRTAISPRSIRRAFAKDNGHCNCSGWPDNTSFTESSAYWSLDKDDDRRLIIINLSRRAPFRRAISLAVGRHREERHGASTTPYRTRPMTGKATRSGTNGLYIELAPWAGQILAFQSIGNPSERA